MGSDDDERRAILNAIEECVEEASRHDKAGNITDIMTKCARAAFVSDTDDTDRPEDVQEHSDSDVSTATDPL